MGEEEIRSYLAAKQPQPPRLTAKPAVRRPAVPTARRKAPDTFKDFNATQLLCPTCQRAMPVKERLMLYLPDGKLFGYYCEGCGTSLGTRKA